MLKRGKVHLKSVVLAAILIFTGPICPAALADFQWLCSVLQWAVWPLF